MKALRILVAGALLLAFAAQVAPAHAQNCSSIGGFYVASVNSNIDPGSADFLSSAVSNAKAACDSHFVLILTTNGGDGVSMESMVASVESFAGYHPGANFTTLISPQGGFAFSAGAYIAEASTSIFMVPGTTIGSATPIISGIPIGEENTTLTKDINALTSYMQTITGPSRNSTATGLMVTKGKSYACISATDCQALRLKVITNVIPAATTSEALGLLGVPSNTPIDTPGVRSVLISIFTDPNVSSLLFLIGVFAIMFDIYHPTLVLSVVGVVVIVMALFGLGLFGASPLAILLMVVGSAFIFLEIKTQHGVSALVGVIIFIVGFLFIFEFPRTPPSGSHVPAVTFSAIPDLTYGLLIALGAAIVIGSIYLRRIRQGLMARPKVFDSSSTLGRKGEMKTDLKSGGKGVALIGAEEWSVTSREDLARGDPITVIAVEGLELVVERRKS